MATAERAWRDPLRAVTLADLAASVDAGAPGTWATLRPWLAGADA